MKKVLILTHGKFAEGIADSLRMIAGEQDITPLCILDDDSPKEVESRLMAYLDQTKPDDTVIIMTDIPGGSSTKSALPLIQTHENVHVVTGLNLALLLEIVLSGDENVAENINTAIENARASIMNLNDVMKQNL